MVYGHAVEKVESLLVPGTAAPGLSALGGHRYTAAGRHESSPLCSHSSPNLTHVFEDSSFVTGAGFRSLSWWMKMLLSTCFVSLLKND